MKIGVIAGGFDMLALFDCLNRYDMTYHIYWDWDNAPYGDKSHKYAISCIKKGIEYLQNQDVNFIIVPPVYELILQGEYRNILPLFNNYLDTVLNYSLIGKVGFVGDMADIQVIDEVFTMRAKNYKLSENQQSIKGFHQPFAIWTKQVGLWKQFLPYLGKRDWMVRKVIKHDLRYFKDADVDTLIPLNRGYMSFDKIIKSKLNFNKARFHGMNVVCDTFGKLMANQDIDGKYSVKLHTNGSADMLLDSKKWMWLLGRGKNAQLQIQEI